MILPTCLSFNRCPPIRCGYSHVHVRSTNLGNILRNASLVSLEVLHELFGEALSSGLVLLAVRPAVDWAQDLGIDTLALAGHLEVEATHHIKVGHVQGLVMDGVNDGSCLSKRHTVTDAVATTHPASVDKPHFGVVFLALFGQHLSVNVGMEGQECLAEAGGESHLRLSDADLSASDLGGVARDEVVHGLLRVQLGHGGHHTEGIACQEDNVFGVASDSWELHITDMLEGVTDASVWGQADIIVVDDALLALFWLIARVFNDGAKLDCVENIGLSCTRETISFRVTATLNVEDVFVGPDVLIITNK